MIIRRRAFSILTDAIVRGRALRQSHHHPLACLRRHPHSQLLRLPLAETKIGTLRNGELEHLAAHGVTPGLVGGIFSLRRQYVPVAEGLIAQVRGSN